MSRQDLLQGRSKAAAPGTVKAGSLTEETGPGLAFRTVGVAGFEPTTSSSRTKRATKLRYTPIRAES